ncbi:MAG: outer membrane lipid asymmetry maintenance protein MlaD [Candidatus Puniceispirillaceae bacterium]|nr:outer membrane lipid asymmetry maintenance protein MlaD [Alphaproteobacteria bacterium]|tara:strand:- start:34 stop:483 length:450 start_codon:yes stop_codon:yes gene_type:complete
MLKRSTLEIVMGLVVLIGAGIFSVLVYQASDIKSADGYLLHAEFGTTGGLSIGDEVRLSGIKVGQIVGQSLDPVTYAARIDMRIDETVQLPSDSSARITAASLLGGNFLELLPGAGEDVMPEGTIIFDTRDPVSLSDLLGKIVFQGNES